MEGGGGSGRRRVSGRRRRRGNGRRRRGEWDEDKCCTHRFPKAQEGTEEGKWQRDAKPEAEDTKESGERDGSRGTHPP